MVGAIVVVEVVVVGFVVVVDVVVVVLQLYTGFAGVLPEPQKNAFVLPAINSVFHDNENEIEPLRDFL